MYLLDSFTVVPNSDPSDFTGLLLFIIGIVLFITLVVLIVGGIWKIHQSINLLTAVQTKQNELLELQNILLEEMKNNQKNNTPYDS